MDNSKDIVYVYVSGPYTAAMPEQRDANVVVARNVAAELIRRGFVPMVPHTMTHGWERHYSDLRYRDYLRVGALWLERCDAILMLPNWERSDGARCEHELACSLGLRIYYDIEELTSG